MYFDRLKKEEMANEYNRTEVAERETGKNLKDGKMNPGGIRVVDKIDSDLAPRSYFSQLKLKQKKQMIKTMNGIRNMSDLCFL